MKLTKISGSCFMGGTFSVELGALNICHGGNDQGKTRLGNCIKVGLLGHLPSLNNKTPNHTFNKLSSGQCMEVNLVFDTGAVIHRSWKQIGDSVKTAKHVPQEFDEKTPLVLLDANDYFGRTARGRVEMVARVAELSFNASLLASEIPKNIVEMLPDHASYDSPQAWIDASLESVEESRKTASADVRRYTQTLQGLSTLQLADKPATRSVEEIDADIQTEQNAAAEKRARRTTLEAEQKKNEERELEREALLHRIQQAGDPPQRDFDSTALRAREKELAGKVRAFDDWNNRKAECERLNAERLSALHKLHVEALELKDKGIKSLLPQIRVIEEAMSKRKTTKCKTCKQSLPTKPVKNEAKLPALREEQYERTRREREVNRLEENITRLERQAPLDPGTKPNDNIEVVRAELTQVRSEIDEYVATADVQAWRKQLNEMPQTVDHSAEIATLTTEAQTHSDRVETLRTERKAAESDRQDRKRLAEAREAQEAAISAEAKYKAAKTFLLQKKAELIETVFGPLLETAGRFMRGIFPTPIEYRDGELGCFNGTSWVTAEVFGGARQKLLYAALQCALGAQSPARIIIMDELSVIDVENTRQFLNNVWDAHGAGLFDQFLGLTARYDGARSGFTTIRAENNGYTVL